MPGNMCNLEISSLGYKQESFFFSYIFNDWKAEFLKPLSEPL